MFEYSDEYIEQLIRGIFTGDITLEDLPEDYYRAVAAYLERGIYKGFGAALEDLKLGTPDYELLEKLRENIYLFSGAKTFQQTFEMSQALTDENGEVRAWEDFKAAAQQIFDTYNEEYLKTERSTAITQAGNARKWEKAQKQKDVLPYLRRVAVGDELECDICSELDGITAPIVDPIWDSVAGAAHFNCRCVEEQLDMEEGEDQEWDDDEMAEAVEKSGMSDEFKFNPGKQKEIFSTEGKSQHPYFQVPKEYRKFAEDNFNLPLPS